MIKKILFMFLMTLTVFTASATAFNQEYINTDYGFRIQPPLLWVVADKDQNSQILQKVIDDAGGRPAIVAFTPSNIDNKRGIIIGIEPLPASKQGYSTVNYFQVMKKNNKQNIELVQLNGRNWIKFDMTKDAVMQNVDDKYKQFVISNVYIHIDNDRIISIFSQAFKFHEGLVLDSLKTFDLLNR